VIVNWVDRLVVWAYPENEISRAIFVSGRYEPNEFFFLHRVLRPGMAFVDVGANMGFYTLFASKRVGATGTVVAIDPSEREFGRLKANVETNALTNVSLLQVAVSDCAGEAELLVATEEKSGHNTLGSFGYGSVRAQGAERVRVERLDDILRDIGLGRVDVVKMDIEGAEFRALQGARETLRTVRPVLLLELSDRSLQHQGCHSSQVWELLAEQGYRLYRFSEETGLPVSAERKPYFDSENVVAVHCESRCGVP
jgi:FkbM family methyltransferase